VTATWRAGRTLIIAHRGASALETENTLAAFRRARTDGGDGVELDVLRCATGEVVVFHDDDLKRLGGRREVIADLPLAAIREVELSPGGRISTLDEVLEELGPTMLVNIELKAREVPDLRLAAAAVGVARRHALGARGLFSSFHPALVGQVRLLDRSLLTGLLFHRTQSLPLREGWLRHVVRPTAVHPEHPLVEERRVGRWRRAGLLINTWTVDDKAEVHRLASLKVDGIITNDPARTRSLLPRPD
jgi:glycerophosphoryl diester phosphodiesterase